MTGILERIYARRGTIARLRAGLLGDHLDGFAASLLEQGYSRSTVRVKIQFVGKFNQWLGTRRVTLKKLDEQVISAFMRDPPTTRRPRDGDMTTLRDLLQYLRDAGVIQPAAVGDDTRGLSPIETKYEQYLIHERGLSQPSTRYHLFHAHRFVSECFRHRPVRFNKLRQSHITQYILHHAPAYRQRSAQTWLSVLRIFLRHLHVHGETASDLSGCVLKTANWNLSVVPKYIEAQAVNQLLRAVDRSTRTGLRDYTILLLLARLGLRGGEIVNMELEDIHWETGELTIRGKNSRWSRLPLPVDVGEAMVAYLRGGRPHCSTRKVFVRRPAPHRGLQSSSVITARVAIYLDRAGIQVPRKGAHVLRHSLATQMLRKGGSLEEVCQVLRHLHRGTTEVYAKVDLHALRALAQPWLKVKHENA
jgi:site-specific recombinase XerD